MNAIAHALITGLFLTQAANPVYAGLFDFKLGGDKQEAGQPSGSAGPDGAQGEAKELEKCDKAYGTLAVVEPQDAVISHLLQYGLQSPTRPDPHDGAAVQLLRAGGARPRHAEPDAGASAGRIRRIAQGIQHGQGPDGDGRLCADA